MVNRIRYFCLFRKHSDSNFIVNFDLLLPNGIHWASKVYKMLSQKLQNDQFDRY